MTLTCYCGYDLANPSGNTHDRAACTQCGWKAAGEGAEHAGTHHWRDTHHTWTLTIYQPDKDKS